MKEISLLCKTQFIESFSFLLNKGKKRWITLGIILGIVVGAIGISALYNYMYYSIFNLLGAQDYYFPMVIGVVSLIVLILSIYRIKGNLFNGNDFDLLQSLPLKSINIVISKIVFHYILTLLISLVAIIPSFVILYETLSISGILVGVLLIPFIPLVPIAVAGLIGFIISITIDRLKFASLFNILFILIITVVIILLSYSAASTANIYATLLDYANYVFPILKLSFKAINLDALSIFIVIGSNIIIFTLFIFFITFFFKKINNMINKSTSTSKYKEGKNKQSSLYKAMFKKEWVKLLNTPIYFVNGFLGTILVPIMGIAGYIMISKMEGGSELIASYSPYIILIIMFGFGMAPITNSSLSLEGKSLWILQTAPDSFKSIIKAKIYTALVSYLPLLVITNIIFLILFKLNIGLFSLIFIISVIFLIAITYIGMLFNLLYPKFDFKNETQVCKQGIAVLFTMFTTFIFILICFLLLFFLPKYMNMYFILSIILGLTILLALIAVILTNKKTKESYY
ncbi:MAG: putative ABC transporter permease subunit [Anaeroplasmataceae bacterium]